MVKSILGSARANLLRTVVLCAVALILGAVAVRALPEIPDLSGYQSYKTYDPIVMADLRYIDCRLWRARVRAIEHTGVEAGRRVCAECGEEAGSRHL